MSNVVKSARLALALTQEELARRADVTVWCVVRAEKLGRVSGSFEGRRLAGVLGLPFTGDERRRRGPVVRSQKMPTGVGAAVEMEATP
jgi:ribosome-binding protein aMBF1 (putative translation factor)